MIYLYLFLEFFKIGLFTFGGGFAMIPLIKDAVLQYGWLSEAQFYSFIGVCESTPGPVAINMATYIGSVQGGILGSLCATLGVILPSFIIILLIASILKNFTSNRFFKAFLRGVNPVVIALIISAGVSVLLKNIGLVSITQFSVSYPSVIIFALIVGVYFLWKTIFKKKPSAIVIIVISAVLGLAVCPFFAF